MMMIPTLSTAKTNINNGISILHYRHTWYSIQKFRPNYRY